MDGIFAKVRGFSKFVSNMRKADERISTGFERGAKRAGLFLFRQAQLKVPVDKGNLKGSGFVRTEGTGKDVKIIIGYTAAYAIYVHENLDAAHGEAYNQKWAADITSGQKHSRGAMQQAKWLENTVRDPANIAEVRRIFLEEVKPS